jgi:hypothetical protein
VRPKSPPPTSRPAQPGTASLINSVVCLIQAYPHTDKKENQIFLIYKDIQSGAVAKSNMRKGFQIYEEMRKIFPIYSMRRRLVIYDFATAPL